MNWDPEQYLKFVEARRRPALDLIARLGTIGPKNVLDLGCGAGNITRLLAEHWPQAVIVGVDKDAAMLRKAASTASPIDWQQCDIVDWRPRLAPDLIFSNAALHWLGDHPQLLPGLIAQLAEGGVLAVQMPSDFVAPSHLARLDAVVREQFLAAYRALLAVVYPRGSDGHTLFPFKRLFIVALR